MTVANVFNYRQPLSDAAETVIGQVMLSHARAEGKRKGLPVMQPKNVGAKRSDRSTPYVQPPVLGYSPATSIAVTLMFTGLSFTRSFILRRIFRGLA